MAKMWLVVVNKHNTARAASCWFIIYYRLVMHENSNIKLSDQSTFKELQVSMVCLNTNSCPLFDFFFDLVTIIYDGPQVFILLNSFYV